MNITYGPAKDERNVRERGLSFDRAREFDFPTALRSIDSRRDYGETRHVALGYLGSRLHVLCFTENDDGIRVISFRRANSREVGRYEKAQAAD